jgi:hypothetical protein
MAIEHFQKYGYSTPEVNSSLSTVAIKCNFGGIPTIGHFTFNFRIRLLPDRASKRLQARARCGKKSDVHRTDSPPPVGRGDAQLPGLTHDGGLCL